MITRSYLRLVVACLVFLLCCNVLFAQPNSTGFWESRRDLESEFTGNIDGLIQHCHESNLDYEFPAIKKFLIPRDPKRQYIFLPPENEIGNDRFPTLSEETKTKLNSILAEHGQKLLELAKSEAANGNGTWSLQLFHEILFYMPDHVEVRRILGHRLIGSENKTWRVKSDRLKVRKSTKAEKELGWPAKSYWIGTTNHFYIVSTAGEDQTKKLALKLERWHDVWRQVFFEYYNSRKNLQRWITGKSKPTPSGRKFKVVFFSDRNEYVSNLKDSIAGIEASTGYYNDAAKRSYFFSSDDKSIHDTWRHELTHQMFQESRQSKVAPFRENFLWLGEGIAMYFESLIDHDDYVTLGGFDARRLQYARLRSLKEQFRLPLSELSSLDMIQFQSLPEVGKAYSQSAGVTQMLMTAGAGKHQRGLIQFLSQIYRGKKKVSIEQSLGLSFAEIENEYDKFLRVDPDEIKFFDPLSHPQELALIGARFEEGSLESLKCIEKLDWLDLSASDVQGSTLTRLKSCKKISQLFLTGAKIDDGAIQSLSLLPVVEIDLSGTILSDKQLLMLSNSKTIKAINVNGTNVTRNGMKAMAKKRPDIELSER